MAEIDLENRDPSGIHPDLKVAFEDVLAEPDGIHSHDCVWGLSYKCFEGGKKICYMILTFLCGAPLALLWGCEFACLAFDVIWQCVPAMRYLQICCGQCQKVYATLLTCFLEPLVSTLALLFSKIHVTNATA